MQSAFLISAPSSNAGKTTLTLGLLRALRNRGHRVQPFKCGPDYIDTIHHTAAAYTPGVNLDTFMASGTHAKALFDRYAGVADVAVAEGVMGLFDGADRMKGSSAEIAALLDIPVILVVSAQSMAYSAAPLIYGFSRFDPRVRVAGVIFNFVNTESHYRFLKEACEDAGIEPLGYLPKNQDLVIPSRHLGLHISPDTDYEAIISKLAEIIPKTIDVDRLIEITGKTDRPVISGHVMPQQVTTSPLRIAVARDEAFSFLYHENIWVLKSMGQVEWFSPLHDRHLPETDLLYLPGGYPELFAAELSKNTSMLHAIAHYCKNGGVAFAECGGLMYLGKSITDHHGDCFEMTDVLNVRTSLKQTRMTLGYRRMNWNGLEINGHEFHYSTLADDGAATEPALFSNAKGVPVDTSLFRAQNTFATYAHFYWGDKPEFISHLIQQGKSNPPTLSGLPTADSPL
nr:cobyrinate a,c-diamide synthase [uncultured Dyadobacter sp.]